MTQYQLQKREAEFLNACGVDTSNGFWSDDVNYWKTKEPELYREHMTMGQPLATHVYFLRPVQLTCVAERPGKLITY